MDHGYHYSNLVITVPIMDQMVGPCTNAYLSLAGVCSQPLGCWGAVKVSFTARPPVTIQVITKSSRYHINPSSSIQSSHHPSNPVDTISILVTWRAWTSLMARSVMRLPLEICRTIGQPKMPSVGNCCGSSTTLLHYAAASRCFVSLTAAAGDGNLPCACVLVRGRGEQRVRLDWQCPHRPHSSLTFRCQRVATPTP